MKSYKEMADIIFQRRDEYVQKQKAKKRAIAVCVTSALFGCVVLLVSFMLWKNGKNSMDIPTDTPSTTLNGETDTTTFHGNRPSTAPPTSQPSTEHSNDTPTTNEPSSGTTNTSVDKTPSTKNPTKSTPDATETSKTTITGNIDNGVLEKVTAERMNVPENMKLLGTNNAKEENNSKTMKSTVALYQLDGDVVNWTTENDLIYVITSGNNRLVVIDSKTMAAICNVPLAGKPAELNLVGENVYISLPDLCRIDVFSKSNFAKTSSLYFQHEVSSFCIDGNYIYYSEHDQWCGIYRKNITTNELTKIPPNRGSMFFQPKLYLNKQDNVLYVGETGITASALYYYDATTLQLKSVFKKNNYGLMNHTRDIFHVGDEIFWGNYRFSDTDANQLIGRYGVADYGSVNFASTELVSTFEGLFLADTYECIINYFDADFDFEYILVTKSNHVFFRSRSVDTNIILGVNFSVQ